MTCSSVCCGRSADIAEEICPSLDRGTKHSSGVDRSQSNGSRTTTEDRSCLAEVPVHCASRFEAASAATPSRSITCCPARDTLRYDGSHHGTTPESPTGCHEVDTEVFTGAEDDDSIYKANVTDTVTADGDDNSMSTTPCGVPKPEKKCSSADAGSSCCRPIAPNVISIQDMSASESSHSAKATVNFVKSSDDPVDRCCASVPAMEIWATPKVMLTTGDSALASTMGKPGKDSTLKCPESPINEPGCCNGTSSPCCDVSCIERIAYRECANEKSANQHSEMVSGKKSCSRHSRRANMKYARTLETLGCICRALLALGQESCCESGKRSYLQKRTSSNMTPRWPSLSSSTICCRTDVSPRPTSQNARSKRSHEGKAAPHPSDDCCHKSRTKTTVAPCADACCDQGKCHTTVQTCGKAYYNSEIEPNQAERNSLWFSRNPDPERGLTGNDSIVLSISGMTCTGCETILKRALTSLEAVKDLETSLVLGRASFTLDPSITSALEVTKYLERTTDFKCKQIFTQDSSLDIIVSGEPEKLVAQDRPDGVTGITIVDRHTIQVAFDPEVIGARNLLERDWNGPVRLASRQDPSLESAGRHVRHIGCMTVLSAILTIPVLVMAWAPIPEREVVYGSASLALATIVQLVVAGPLYPRALKSLMFSKLIEMDLLVVLSTTAAYVFSVVSFGYLVAGSPLATGEFFETSTLLVTLIMLGRWISALARHKAIESISVTSLQTPTAMVVDAMSGSEQEIDVRLLQLGDIFKVSPDSRVPTDGTVISGSSEVDESMVTGEAIPVEKYVGSSIVAGSINGPGTLMARLTNLPNNNTIAAIATLVDQAKFSKPKIQESADQVATYFVPLIIALTIITFVTWIGVGISLRDQSGSEATIHAITYAITVLVVSCPCAIGLAVPMVIVIASGVAAKHGIIFKSANSIEIAHKASHVVFDKTGTLTQGKLAVMHEELTGDDPESLSSVLLGLLGSIKHPVSVAVVKHLEAKGVSAAAVTDARSLTGKGVEGTISGKVLRAGNSRWLGVSLDPRVQSVLSCGHTAFCVTVDDALLAVYGLADSLRPDAFSTVTELQRRSISVHLVSGDDDAAVRAVAVQLGIPASNVLSRCTPGDKQAYIQRITDVPNSGRGHRNSKEPIVIFLGDGSNDAVALAQASIGVNMSSGTDIAKSAADIVLMHPSLSGVLTIIAVSRKSINRVRFNFAWSFIYNLFAILLAAGAFVNARIPPEYAGLGELVSVLPVVAAAVLLRWSKFRIVL